LTKLETITYDFNILSVQNWALEGHERTESLTGVRHLPSFQLADEVRWGTIAIEL